MPDSLFRIREIIFPAVFAFLLLALLTTVCAQQSPLGLGTAGAGAPGAIGTPGALGSPSAFETLAPLARPTPTTAGFFVSRPFYCSCSTGGQPVAWAGRVLASSYTQARQAAVGQCSRFLGSKPLSPIIPTPGGFGGRGNVPTPAPPLFNPCALCACN